MRDVVSMNVRQVRIYGPDIIPFRFLRTKLGIDFLMNQFQFKEQFAAEGGELYFTGGTFASGSSADDLIIPIGIVAVNDRRIIVDVAGPTEWAGLVFDALRFNISSMDPERKLSTREPLVLANETQCAVTMDFNWQDLLAEPLVQFLSDRAVNAMEASGGAPRLSSMSLKFTISFATDPKLAGSGITLSDKTFTVEPRTNTPFEDQCFYTASPLDSATHLELLVELEQAILGRRGRRRKSLPAAS